MTPKTIDGQNNHVFTNKKAEILQSLNTTTASYKDASLKGSVDESIRNLIDLINASDEYVTTSSCSGRVAVFLDGSSLCKENRVTPDSSAHPADEECSKESNIEDVHGPKTTAVNNLKITGAGKGQSGKASGGRWLFVSHSKFNPTEHFKSPSRFLGLGVSDGADGQTSAKTHEARFVHFKFEPMVLLNPFLRTLNDYVRITFPSGASILHVLTASTHAAQRLLTAGLQAGFRESGVTGITSSCPLVAIRCQGLALDCIVGSCSQVDGNDIIPLVSDGYLGCLVDVANDRFDQNLSRVHRLESLITSLKDTKIAAHTAQDDSEIKSLRRIQKRSEGLRRQQQFRAAQSMQPQHEPRCVPENDIDLTLIPF